MTMRYMPNQESYRRMTTEELRKAFLLDGLFVPGAVSMVFTDADRAIAGGAVPAGSPLRLPSDSRELAATSFTERREIGIVNLGGPGRVIAGGQKFTLAQKDMLYVGRGRKDVEFESVRASDPAVFYFLSYPAHAEYPTVLATHADAEKNTIGTPAGASRRTINKYIHPGGVKSCQLVMGLTDLEAGSVWNTMPPHTHSRRMEVYLYFGMEADAVAVHLMGEPTQTRSLILRNRQGVISPSWSIHCAAATGSYSFVWGMGGENQEFADMDQVLMADLL